jgi:hypothetical protein
MNRLCTVLAGIVACSVLMSHSGYAAQPKASDSAQQATLDHDMMRSIEVVKISVDTVGLGIASKVSISVQCRPKRVKNVTARIVPDSGYEIVRQPQEMYSEPDTETVVFTAMIRATARGIWEVGLATSGICSDTTTRTTFLSDFFIQISDTLNRAMTFVERMRLISPYGNVPPQSNRDSITILPSQRGPSAKPHIPDSLLQKRNPKGKRSGTFNINGCLLYHDARDPQGSYRPAVNCDVEVWNDNYYDNPSSSDTYLGTTITGWDGSIWLYWLDNSDGDGTADPYFIFRTENATWVVAPASGWGAYGWRSTTVRDVCDGETVNLGTTRIFGGLSYYEQAMWCFQDINQGWYTAENAGTSPSHVSCIWPASGIPHVNLLGDTIFISHQFEQAIDVVDHEYGHCLMLQPYSNGVIWGCNEKGLDEVDCLSTAWREGWATFFALAVTPDGIMDYDTAGVGEHFTIEIPRSYSFAQGPSVSGRVAGALLDLWDTNNDGLDQNSTNTITLGTLLTSGVRSHTDSAFYNFWSYLRNNKLNTQQIALGLKSIVNNTIHFDCTFCGDANGDSTIDISDVVFLIAHIFSGGRAPGDCNYAKGRGDANGDGAADISDVVYLIARVFSGGPAPHCQGMAQLTRLVRDRQSPYSFCFNSKSR